MNPILSCNPIIKTTLIITKTIEIIVSSVLLTTGKVNKVLYLNFLAPFYFQDIFQ